MAAGNLFLIGCKLRCLLLTHPSATVPCACILLLVPHQLRSVTLPLSLVLGSSSLPSSHVQTPGSCQSPCHSPLSSNPPVSHHSSCHIWAPRSCHSTPRSQLSAHGSCTHSGSCHPPVPLKRGTHAPWLDGVLRDPVTTRE
ncbi:hypothetical protein GDO78_019253 [Eleutherodactylus coqui]|uniref:Uncharacterized protein n=1 Tax=Eleutherodactylus coqui TaxID=57060 RepID=A0A8J6B9K7_ELECQ|nr:hypothetical protein GDO78_019253 [Eleutherodactylus coqui]